MDQRIANKDQNECNVRLYFWPKLLLSVPGSPTGKSRPRMEMPQNAIATPTKNGIVGGVEGQTPGKCCEKHAMTGLCSPHISAPPTKNEIVGGVEGQTPGKCCEKHAMTGLCSPHISATPTKNGIVGGVDRALMA